jgi:plasmid stability protein
MDEAMPHMHVLIVPVIQGRLRGSDAIGYGRHFTSLLRSFHVEVAAAFGLRVYAAANAGRSRKAAAKAVLQHLAENEDPVFDSAAYPVIKEVIEAQPAKFAALLNLNWDDTPARRMRTMTEIFTSPGRGSQHE